MSTANFISLAGVFVLVAIGILASNNRKRIIWKLVAVGIVLQVVFALLILHTGPGRDVFDAARKGVNQIMTFTTEGAQFVFGTLAVFPFPPQSGKAQSKMATDNQFVNPKGEKAGIFSFAFLILPTIIFFGAFMSILYHLGIMQRVVKGMAWVMQKLMGTSGSESLSVAANVFVGQTEAPLVIKPYLDRMTTSELMALMTGGFATMAGGVLVAYAAMGASAGHLLAASIMSAPAALVMAKLWIPETEHSLTAGTVELNLEKTDPNVVGAATTGASDGLKLAINVAAMLIAFVALVAMVNALLAWLKGFVGWSALPGSLGDIFAFVFRPIAFVMGVPWSECGKFGELIGTKLTLTEFLAYLQLFDLKNLDLYSEVFSNRSYVIATYALCGFANVGSVGIQIGGIGALVPSRRSDLARVGFKAMFAGALASFMTAALAGFLISNASSDFSYVRNAVEKATDETARDKEYGKALLLLAQYRTLHPTSSYAARAKELEEGVLKSAGELRDQMNGDWEKLREEFGDGAPDPQQRKKLHALRDRVWKLVRELDVTGHLRRAFGVYVPEVYAAAAKAERKGEREEKMLEERKLLEDRFLKAILDPEQEFEVGERQVQWPRSGELEKNVRRYRAIWKDLAGRKVQDQLSALLGDVDRALARK